MAEIEPIFSQYTNASASEVLKMMGVLAGGISKKESEERQKTYGFNEIKTSSVNTWEVFMRQCKSPFFYLIFIAAIISFFVGEVSDGIVIITTAVINITIGFFQEYRAERAIFMLRKFIPQQVKVLRPKSGSQESEEEIIEKSLLVPGDVVVFQSGDIIPADVRILECEGLQADESALTGESVPLPKTAEAQKTKAQEMFQAHNILFAGSSVLSGRAHGLVVATAKHSAFGRIVHLVSGVNKQSAYEKNITYFCKLVLRVVGVTILFMVLANLIFKGAQDIAGLTLFSIAMIISVLPEALPAVVIFAMSKGSIQMAKKHVVVRRLSAIEDLGNIEVLCTDKTGTLTENKLSVKNIVSADVQLCQVYGMVRDGGNEKFAKTLDPFELAINQGSQKSLVAMAKKYQVLSELAFDSFRMRYSVLARGGDDKTVVIVRGAPEIIFKKCTKFLGQSKVEIQEGFMREGAEGKRVLAIAFKEVADSKKTVTEKDEKGLTFLGYFVFEDPLKSTATEAIKLSKKLGVDVKIITGDSVGVAGYIGRKIGLVDEKRGVISGADLQKLSGDDFAEACLENAVFARISPEQKYAIIKSLQKTRDVGFLGEGINDAPALKLANVSIAVPSASDISREVSDVVMLRKDLRVIVEGIKEGRMVFANINKYIKSMLASNFGNFYSIAIVSLFINYLPMLPIQILLGNLLSDFPLVSVATDSIDAEELKKPKMYQLHHLLPLVIALGLVSTIFDFIFFMIFKNNTPATVQSLWFVESILTELALIFVIRTRHKFWKAKRPGKFFLFLTVFDAILIIALPFLAIGQKLFHFVPIPIPSLLLLFILVIICTFVSEVVKLTYFRFFNKPPKIHLAHD